MTNNIKWIAELTQKSPLLGLVVSLLIGIMFTAGGMTLLYSDGKSNSNKCEKQLAEKDTTITYLRTVIEQKNTVIYTQAEEFYKEQKHNDSVSMVKLKEINDNLEAKSKQQREVNELQKSNIIKRDETLKINKTIKQQNEQKIKSLKNELKE